MFGGRRRHRSMKNPESTLRLVCDLVGVAFEPSMLEWEPKELKSWQKFRGWHEDASNSTGFQAIEKAPLQYPPEVFAGAKTCRPTTKPCSGRRRELSITGRRFVC